MINYFFNITVPEFDNTDLSNDVLTMIRNRYHITRESQKNKFSTNSDSICIFYDYSIEKDRTLKWQVYDEKGILSDSKSIDADRYCVNYYKDYSVCKRIIFSKYHTLLRVEYYDLSKSPEPYCTIEPRKASTGLCLLLNRYDTIQPFILYSMPDVYDEYILDKISSEFTDYTALASTNEGIVRFMTKAQLEQFELFVDRCAAIKLTQQEPKRYIDESEALLAKRLNPKDFNVRRNLSQTFDITRSDDFVPEDAKSLQCDQSAVVDTTDSSFVLIGETDILNDTQATDTQSYSVDVDATLAAFLKEASGISAGDALQNDNSSSGVFAENPVVPQTNNEASNDQIDALNADAEIDDNYISAAIGEPDLEINSLNNQYFYYGQLSDNKRNGYGRTATADGHTVYEGSYVDNKRCGKGSYFYRDGSLCYYGDWKDNNRDGFGIGISSVDKSIHIGSFVSNKPDGNGVRLNSNGDVNFIKRTLSDGSIVVIKLDNDKLILSRYNENGDKISDNITDLTNL